MPKRTKEQREKIDALEKIKPDKNCNARTGGGKYCRNVAGFKTDHLGTGRCYLHGGASGGRPIVTGMFSKNLTSDLQTEFDKLVKDPALIDLYSELALTKVFLSSLIKSIRTSIVAKQTDLESYDVDEMDDENVIKQTNWMTEFSTKSGTYVPSAELNTFLKIMEMTRKIYKDIVDAETKTLNTLTIKQVHNIVSQIGSQMAETCGACPVRKEIAERLATTKMMNLSKD